ncbi:MAG: PT domain-containing protein [Caldilineales bacterium]|nr:PT domain-containing protein [Caldilineales bacterium]
MVGIAGLHVNPPIYQFTNQPTNQLTNQPTNQPTNLPIPT